MPLSRRAIIVQHLQSAISTICRTPDLETLVLHFFCGAEALSDAQQYVGTGTDPLHPSLTEMLRVGANSAELLELVQTLETSGRLRRVGGGDPRRYRAEPSFGGQLPELVRSFFCFGEGHEAGYSLQNLYAWGNGVPATEAEFNEAVNRLVEEGHIYSTIDDRHFKATGFSGFAPN